MQYVLSMFVRGNNAEVFDNDTPGGESYAFLGLEVAIREGKRRLKEREDIEKINVYKVFDGVKQINHDGSKYQIAHTLLRP